MNDKGHTPAYAGPEARTYHQHAVTRGAGWSAYLHGLFRFQICVRGFSEALGREVRSWGIRVSTVFPGGVRTGFAREAVERRKTGITTPAFLALTPESVAQRIVRLARWPKRSLILPGILSVAPWLNMLWPGMIDWFAVRNFVRKERAAEFGEEA